MQILITGSNGFLGSEVVRQATQAGLNIRATDRGLQAETQVDYRRADILEPASLGVVMENVNCAVHIAGLAHVFGRSQIACAPFRTVNVIGTENVAYAAAEAGVQHLILVSSVAVYGGIAIGVDEKTPCHPEGPYAESKWQAEQQAIKIAEKSGMSLTILRLATLYGEGDPGNVARLMRAIDRGHFIWVGNGENRKSLLYRGDAARACLAVLCRGGVGIQTYNVSAPPCTMHELVVALALALGRPLPPLHIPGVLALRASHLLAMLLSGRGVIGSLQITVQKWLADDAYDATKFERALGFRTEVTLAEGLAREVAWYRNQPH